MLQNSPTKCQKKPQHIVNKEIFVLSDLIFHLISYKFMLPEWQAPAQQALARHHPPAQRTILLAVAVAAAPGSEQEQIHAKEKTTLIPPPPQGRGRNNVGAAPREASWAGEPAWPPRFVKHTVAQSTVLVCAITGWGSVACVTVEIRWNSLQAWKAIKGQYISSLTVFRSFPLNLYIWGKGQNKKALYISPLCCFNKTRV